MADSGFVGRLKSMFGFEKKDAFKTRILRPEAVNGGLGVNGWFVRESPGAMNQEVRALKSTSMAHGYYMVCNRSLYDLLDEMYETDPVIKLCVDLLVALVLTRPREFTLNEEDKKKPKAEEILEFCNETFFGSDAANTEDLLWFLTIGALKHGRSTCEGTWTVKNKRQVWEKFYHCHPGQFTFDRDGNLYLYDGTDSPPQLPQNKFVSAKGRTLYDNPFGESAYYAHRYFWLFKKKGWVSLLRYAMKFTNPFIHVEIDPTSPDAQRAMDEIEETLKTIEDDAALITGNGEKVNVYQRSQGGMSGSSAGIFDVLIQRIDSYFTRSMLGAELNTTAGEKGARSLGEVHQDTTATKVIPVVTMTEGTFNSQAVRPQVVNNFGPGAPVPYYKFDVEKDRDVELAMKIIETAVKLGVDVAIQQAREWLGIRPVMPGEETLKKPEPQVIQVPLTPPANDEPGSKPESEEGIQSPKPEDETEPEGGKQEPESEPGSVPKGKKDETGSPGNGKKGKAVPAKGGKMSFFAEEMGEHSFCSTQFDCGEEVSKALAEWVSDKLDVMDISEQNGGVETQSRMTVLYGLKPDTTPEDVRKAVAGEWWQWLLYGKFGVFEQDDCDMLYVEMYPTEELLDLRAALEKLPNENSYEYHPHVTVAYLHKGCGQKYLEAECPVDGWVEWRDRLVFSDTEEERTEIVLTGPEVWMRGGEEELRRFQETGNGLRGMVTLASSEDWFSTDSRGEALRKEQREHALSNALRGSVMSEKIARLSARESKVAIIAALHSMANLLREKYHDDELMDARMRSFVDLNTDAMKESLNRAIFAEGLLVMATCGEDLRYVMDMDALNRKFSEDDPFADLPPDFRAAAEWMSQRGVMTTAEVKSLASQMAPIWNVTAQQAEHQLRDQVFALFATVDTKATAKIQELIVNAVGRGKTVSQFLGEVDEALGLGDLPGDMDRYWENVFRTELSKCYSEQQAHAESQEIYRNHLWGHEGWNPCDQRSDKTHKAISGVRFQKGSTASQTLGWSPFRYQCRCVLAALMAPKPEKSPYVESSNALSVAAALKRFFEDLWNESGCVGSDVQ